MISFPWAVIYGALIVLCISQRLALSYVFPASSWISQTDTSDSVFTARNGHRSVVFDDKLWVVGGRTDSYKAYNLVETTRLGDVWYSDDYGVTWNKNILLTGDFWAQNYDAMEPGELAPWYARFGHTLDVMDVTDSSGTTQSAMILTGGYTPNPNNDVWISLDGVHWRLVQYSSWSARGWHSSAVFEGKLYIMGGSPLTNDVWYTQSISQASSSTSSSSSAAWSMEWIEVVPSGSTAPWSPRCGMAVTVISHTAPVGGVYNSTLYLTGGYGGWPTSSKKYDGLRSRGDVYATKDGQNWTVVLEEAPWDARSWHSLVTWTSLDDEYTDVGGTDGSTSTSSPRMWLAGGAYKGTDGNNIVYDMVAYVDMWYSRDGVDWYQVNYEEGSGSTLYSNMEWALTQVDDSDMYIGKWGHSMLAWKKVEEDDTGANAVGTVIPALYLIAGDQVDSASMSYEVFVSNDTLLCSKEGIVCAGVGSCEGFKCVCPTSYSGDFCTEGGKGTTSAAVSHHRVSGHRYLTIVALISAMLLLSA